MAICNWCSQEMSDEDPADTCTANVRIEFNDGVELGAVRYHEEENSRCHDCNIMPGGFHHPGCDMEECPNCGGQLISCGCLPNEEEEEDEQ